MFFFLFVYLLSSLFLRHSNTHIHTYFTSLLPCDGQVLFTNHRFTFWSRDVHSWLALQTTRLCTIWTRYRFFISRETINTSVPMAVLFILWRCKRLFLGDYFLLKQVGELFSWQNILTVSLSPYLNVFGKKEKITLFKKKLNFFKSNIVLEWLIAPTRPHKFRNCKFIEYISAVGFCNQFCSTLLWINFRDEKKYSLSL